MAKIEERYHKRELKLKIQKGGPAATDDEYLMELNQNLLDAVKDKMNLIENIYWC